jgi:hypothetical protein
VQQVIVLAVFVAIVLVVAVVGLRLGMLVAPRIDRLTEPHDEAEGGDDDRPDG